MKLRHLLFGLLAGVAFVACTNDDDPAGVTPVDGNKVATAPKYMSVNFAMPSGAATRADGDLVPADIKESLINNAQFLFFKGENQVAAPCKIVNNGPDVVNAQGPYASQKDLNWDTKEAVVVMDNPTAIPTSLVVLINYGEDIAQTTSLTELKAIVDDYSNVENGIVMSNAVYNDGLNNVIGAPVVPANVCETPDAARTNPVQVNVDRVLAKVQVKNSVAANAATGEANVTVDLTGWSLVYNNTQSYLIKKLASEYALPTTFTWNDATNKRSYWADAATYKMGAFPKYNAITKEFDANVYTQENTAFFNKTFEEPKEGVNPTDNPTAVIVAATLKYKANDNEEAAAVNLYKFRGVLYTEADFKTLLAEYANIFKVTVEDEGTPNEKTIYTKLQAEDFKDVLKFDEEAGASYEAKVYLELKSTAGNFVTADKKPIEDVAKALEDAGQIAQFWNGGKTYYFIPIKQHVGDPEDEDDADVFGIVRNHYYQLDLKSVTGLGTAVPNPEMEIVPITPEDEYYYLAAKITVLDWKVVTQNVDLK